MRRFVRLKSRYDLDELHYWDRIHEVHADDLMGTIWDDTANFGNRDR